MSQKQGLCINTVIEYPQISPWTHVPHVPSSGHPWWRGMSQPTYLPWQCPLGSEGPLQGVALVHAGDRATLSHDAALNYSTKVVLFQPDLSYQPCIPPVGTSPGPATESCLSISVSMIVGTASSGLFWCSRKKWSPQERVKLVRCFID